MSVNDLPPGFREMLKNFTIAVMKKKPKSVHKFAASYFGKLADNENDSRSHASDRSDSICASIDDVDDLEMMMQASGGRRKTVAAEKYDPEGEENNDDNWVCPKYPKSHDTMEKLKQKCKNVLLFNALDDEQLQTVLEAMFEKVVSPDETLITQGEEGDNFYVIMEGTYDVFINEDGAPKKIMEYNNKGSFGELALMYDAPRAATVIATSSGVVFAMDRVSFRRIVLQSTYKKRRMFEMLLENVPILKSITEAERLTLSDALKVQIYEDGKQIIKQGEPGEEMYFIESGEVQFTMTANGVEKPISKIGKNSYFGELALITRSPRAASAYAIGKVRLAVLEVNSFERLLGPCLVVMKRNIDDYKDQVQGLFEPEANEKGGVRL